MAKVRKKFKYKNKYQHGGVHDPAVDSFSGINNNQALGNERLAFFAANTDTYDEEGEYNPIFSSTDVFEGPSGGAITPDNLPASILAPAKVVTIPAKAIGKPLVAALNKTPIPKYARAIYGATKETLGQMGLDAARKIAPKTTRKIMEHRAATDAATQFKILNPSKPIPVTDEALDQANIYNEMWFNAPETQRKISQAFGSPFQISRPLQPFGKSS